MKTTREFVSENFRSDNERGLALLANLFESEDWTVKALEKIAYDSKLNLPATVSIDEPGMIVASGWTIIIEDSYVREESNDIGIVAPMKHPSTIVVKKPGVKRYYTHEGKLIRMVYHMLDRVIECRYWPHSIGWNVKFYGGNYLSIEVDDSKHEFNFENITVEQVLACELALNLISENEAVTEDTYKYICEMLDIVEKPVSRFYMTMYEVREGEVKGFLREKLLYIDGKLVEKAVSVGDVATFLKFEFGLKKVFYRNSHDQIVTITFGTDGEVSISDDTGLSAKHQEEIIKWAEEVFETAF